MVNTVVAAASTASYEISYPTKDNPYDWVVDWSGAVTSPYLGALPSAFEQAIDYSRTETVPLLLTRLAEVLPRRMSKTYVEQLRARFPQPPATDDPATYEFETHQD